MISKLCSLVGHRRDKRRARPHFETWRSECMRCGVPLVRSAPGLWTHAPTLEHSLRSAPVTSDGDGLCYPERAKPNLPHVMGKDPFFDLPFSHEFARAICRDRPSPTDRQPVADCREHYLARSAECRRLASAAADRSIALIHLDMATRYDMLAKQAEEERRQLHVVR